jgi:hypothetical protein
MLVPSKHVSVSVRRVYDTKELTLEVAAAPAATTRTRADQVQALIQMSATLASGPSQGQVFIAPGQPTRAGGFGPASAMPSTRPLVRAVPLNILWGAEVGALGGNAGVVILNVPAESQASKLGFKITDVIVKVGGAPVTSLADLHLQVDRQTTGKFEVEIRREGKTKKIEVKK